MVKIDLKLQNKGSAAKELGGKLRASRLGLGLGLGLELKG